MQLKREKEFMGKPYSWSDYISLSFTNNVIFLLVLLSLFLLFLNLNRPIQNDCLGSHSSHFKLQVINETLRMGNIINAAWRKALKDVHIRGMY